MLGICKYFIIIKVKNFTINEYSVNDFVSSVGFGFNVQQRSKMLQKL